MLWIIILLSCWQLLAYESKMSNNISTLFFFVCLVCSVGVQGRGSTKLTVDTLLSFYSTKLTVDTLLSFYTEEKAALIPGGLLQAETVANELGSWLGMAWLCQWAEACCFYVGLFWVLTHCRRWGMQRRSRAVVAALSNVPSTSKSTGTIALDGHGKLNPWILFRSLGSLLCPLKQGPKDNTAWHGVQEWCCHVPPQTLGPRSAQESRYTWACHGQQTSKLSCKPGCAPGCAPGWQGTARAKWGKPWCSAGANVGDKGCWWLGQDWDPGQDSADSMVLQRQALDSLFKAKKFCKELLWGTCGYTTSSPKTAFSLWPSVNVYGVS